MAEPSLAAGGQIKGPLLPRSKEQLYSAGQGQKTHQRVEGFFRNAPIIDDSIEGLRYLNDQYNVLIVSSATEFPNSLNEKLEWLNEYYPFISWKQMIFCGEKKSIKGDIMIDDHIKNLQYFQGEKILFTQPHNIYIDSISYKRVHTWKEIMTIL